MSIVKYTRPHTPYELRLGIVACKKCKDLTDHTEAVSTYELECTVCGYKIGVQDAINTAKELDP